ncbi:MAG: MFS transporter [Anaerolineae bacterium]|nr:MFS transporter [Anaerolineae bacterium]
MGWVATSPGQSFTVSLFFDYFIDDFGLSRTMVSSLYGAGTFGGSLALTWIGLQIDRQGNRKMGVIIGICFTLALVMMSFVMGPISLLIGFIAIRGFGQGALSLVNTTVMAEWFQRLRGRMMSLSLVAFALFQAVYIPWLQSQLQIYGWRHMWLVLGIGVAVVVIPLTWVLMRNKPEEYGLLPDGDVRNQKSETQEAEITGWTLREAMRTSTFWVLLFGRLISPAWGTGIIIHQISIFNELGHSAATAATTYSMITLIMAGASIGFGILVDKLRPGVVMAIQLVALIVAMITINYMTNQYLIYVYALGFGLVMGGGAVFDGAVWANLFGRKYQGSIRGFVITAMVASSAAGPVILGISFDYFGGYAPALWLGVALSAIAGTGAMLVKNPRKAKDIVA